MNDRPRQNSTSAVTKATIVGIVINVVLSIAKIVVGLFGRSAALLADGVHSLSDLLTDFVVLVSYRLGGRPADADHPYGHGKFETLGATIIGLILCVVGLGLLFDGTQSLWNALWGQLPARPTTLVVWVAVGSLIAKELLFRYTIAVARRVESPSLEANAWHQRSDALSSLGTAIGAGAAALLGGSWVVLDPIAAIVVAAIIIRVALGMVRRTLHELLDGSDDPEALVTVEASMKAVPEARNLHDLRVRRIGNARAVEAHFEVPRDLTVDEANAITERVERAIQEALGGEVSITLRVDPSQSQ